MSHRREGWHGWDEYAPFYDWENARTLGRRDVTFWIDLARQARGRVLELGCGTGRVSIPLVEAGVDLIGIDRSAAMLDRSAKASRSIRSSRTVTAGARGFSRAIKLIRGDIRALPLANQSISTVIAPYGILQSMIRPRDLTRTLSSIARVIERGGTFGVDLVPDVPRWREYENQVQLRGRNGNAHVTLIESVRQDRRRRLTIFEQCYVERERTRARTHRFELTFRTLTVTQMTRVLERAGFRVTAVLGDYRGRRWDPRADVWIILAKRG